MTVVSEVAGSYGGGVYAVGETVQIYAGTTPSSKQFKNWTTTSSGVTFADPNSETTTFVMPAHAVTVTANFESASSTPKYAVTVSSAGTGASGSGSYAVGAKVTISAGTPPSGRRFSYWVDGCNRCISFANANNATTSFTMPANSVTVYAVFEEDGSGTPTTTVYTVTVSSRGAGYSGGGSYAIGETVTIYAGAPPSEQRFKNWTTSTSGVSFADPNSETTTFTMPSRAVTVTANFESTAAPKYTVTVSSKGSGYSGGGSYEKGETVSIYAGTPPSGQEFKNWTTTSSGVSFDNANSAATMFVMPGNSVTVTANFEGKSWSASTINWHNPYSSSAVTAVTSKYPSAITSNSNRLTITGRDDYLDMWDIQLTQDGFNYVPAEGYTAPSEYGNGNGYKVIISGRVTVAPVSFMIGVQEAAEPYTTYIGCGDPISFDIGSFNKEIPLWNYDDYQLSNSKARLFLQFGFPGNGTMVIERFEIVRKLK